jgi:hypothetical protein
LWYGVLIGSKEEQCLKSVDRRWVGVPSR